MPKSGAFNVLMMLFFESASDKTLKVSAMNF